MYPQSTTDTALLVPIFRRLLDDPQVCPVRLSRAAELYGSGAVERRADGRWLVVSATSPDLAHLVSADARVCSCQDFAVRAARGLGEQTAPCKHCLAVRICLAVEEQASPVINLPERAYTDDTRFVLTKKGEKYLDLGA